MPREKQIAWMESVLRGNIGQQGVKYAHEINFRELAIAVLTVKP